MRKKNWEHLQMDWLIWIQLLKSNVHLLLETLTSNSWRRNGGGGETAAANWPSGETAGGETAAAKWLHTILNYSVSHLIPFRQRGPTKKDLLNNSFVSSF
jgi:hypothetical protein